MRRALPIAEQAIGQARAAFSETRMAGLLEYLRVDEEIVYSLAADAPRDADARQLAMTMALLRKGRLLEELRRTYAVLQDASFTGVDAAAWQRLKELRSRLAMVALLAPGRVSDIATIGREIRQLEDRLAQSTALGQCAAAPSR